MPSGLWRNLPFEAANENRSLFNVCHDCVFMCGRSLCVILVFSTKGQRFLRVGLAVPLFGSMTCLRRMVANEGKLSPDQVNNTFVYSSM